GLACQRLDGAAANHALGDLALGGFGSRLQACALAEALTEATVSGQWRGTRRDQVTHAREPGHGARIRAELEGQPGRLSKSAGNDCGIGICPEATARGDARGQRDDVLRGTGNLSP